MPWIGAAIQGGINAGQAITHGNVKGGLAEATFLPGGSKMIGNQDWQNAGASGGGKALTPEQALAEQMRFSTETAKRLIPEAETDLQAALDYWMPLLKGDRTKMTEAAAPEINTLLGLYDTAQRQVSELQPRGGARSAKMADLPFAKIGDITDILLNLRKAAAGEVAGIGSTLLTGGVGLLSGSGSAASALLQAELTKRGQTMSALGQAGQGVGTILATYLMKGGGGSTGGSSIFSELGSSGVGSMGGSTGGG